MAAVLVGSVIVWKGRRKFQAVMVFLPICLLCQKGGFRVISSAQMRNLRSKDEKTLNEVCPS